MFLEFALCRPIGQLLLVLLLPFVVLTFVGPIALLALLAQPVQLALLVQLVQLVQLVLLLLEMFLQRVFLLLLYLDRLKMGLLLISD
jgi:hypothetical protein